MCSDPKLPPNECKCQYWPEKDPGASKPAFCTGYYTGGRSGVHHWACCNNCNDTNKTCDGVTWQGGSSEVYCGPCGTNSNGGGRVKYYFNCGSCRQQELCSEYCSGRNLPGLCWKWLDCFRGCCLANAQQPSRNKRQIETTSFCGDGTCGSGETPNTCPSDCCYQINPVCDPSNPNLCENECCEHSSCCLEGTTSETTPTTTPYKVKVRC